MTVHITLLGVLAVIGGGAVLWIVGYLLIGLFMMWRWGK